MGYIRTDDLDNLIVDLENMTISYTIVDNIIDFGFTKLGIIKQADTIEELFDCYVLENKTGDDFDVLSKTKMEALIRFVPKDYNCYGAILVLGEGLVYVAKMKGVLPNGEIDWELI